MVLLMENRDHDGCLADQVKLTRALTWDLEEVVKEIWQLGDHGEEASRRITEVEALCKQKEDAAKKLKEEKATLEGMALSCDELLMEMAGLNCMGEGDKEDDSDEEEDDDNGGHAAAPPTIAPPPVAMPPAATSEVIIFEEEEDPMEMVLK
jgi:hypothetical protein